MKICIADKSPCILAIGFMFSRDRSLRQNSVARRINPKLLSILQPISCCCQHLPAFVAFGNETFPCFKTCIFILNFEAYIYISKKKTLVMYIWYVNQWESSHIFDYLNTFETHISFQRIVIYDLTYSNKIEYVNYISYT